MTVHLVTFSDENMDRASQLCAMSAKAYGQVDSTWIYEPAAVARFRSDLSWLKQRGCGFWWWKPAIILEALERTGQCALHGGDILIYADAGVEFIDNVNHIIDRMDQDIFLFGNMYEHAHWCKRDIVEAIMPRTPWEFFGKQVQASVIFFRVNDRTKAFVRQWLEWCLAEWKCDDGFGEGRLIDDSPSWTPNHPGFKENRHDQAILTTMAYRDGYKLHWWPASYNDGAFIYPRGDYPDEGYPVLFHHHRRRNHEWEQVA